MYTDLETSILELRTYSSLGSDKKVKVEFFRYYSSSAGGVTLQFTSTPQYELYKCTNSRTDFPTELPTEEEKVWRISLTKTSGIRLVIHCNEVQVLNVLMSDSTCGYSSWNYYWSRDVEKIRFNRWDSASEYYRLRGKGMAYRGISFKLSSVDITSDLSGDRTVRRWTLRRRTVRWSFPERGGRYGGATRYSHYHGRYGGYTVVSL